MLNVLLLTHHLEIYSTLYGTAFNHIQTYSVESCRHNLCHTCASLLLANGVPMKKIQIWLGHSTFSTTADTYAHLDSSAQEESASVMEGMYSNKSNLVTQNGENPPHL